MALSSQIIPCIWRVFFLCCVFGLAAGSPRHAVPDAFGKVPYSQKPPQGSTPPVVAILNGVGYHTEVYCALLWSFMRAGTLPEVFVLKEATSGIQDVISDWYPLAFKQYSDFLEHACAFKVVVFATFPEHHLDVANMLADRACPGQHFLLVIHNPSGLESSGARAFLSRVNATIVALAPHTVRVASEALHLMTLPDSVPVRLFIPVFPIKDLSDGCQASGICSSPQAQRRTFLLQGLFQSQRRDYSGLFDSVAKSKELTSASNFTLRLIGKGELAIPASLRGRVIKDTDLAYEEYYKAVGEALAVLPAFSSDAYYTRKASSSVATAIICGTPLLGDQQLLDTYTYLTGPAVYVKQPGKSDADAMARLLSITADEDAARRDAIKNLREGLYSVNGDVIGELLTNALQ